MGPKGGAAVSRMSRIRPTWTCGRESASEREDNLEPASKSQTVDLEAKDAPRATLPLAGCGA